MCLSAQMGAGLGAAPAAMPAALSSAPAIGGGLGDLFDLGGGVGMPTGSYVPPKTVSIESINILRLQQSFISIFPSLSQFVIQQRFLDFWGRTHNVLWYSIKD